MIKEAIDKVLGLSVPNQIEHDGRLYVDKKMIELRPELPLCPDVMNVNTLSGIVDYIKAGVDDENGYIIHIDDYNRVLLIGEYNPEFCLRKHYIHAASELKRFQFGAWHDHETFIINMLSFFNRYGEDNDFGKLMVYLNQVSVEKGVSLKDDGITQQSSVKTGVVSIAAKDVPNPVSLFPYETFPEIDEMKRTFVFRVREGRAGGIECALFESGDTKWKLDYIQAIRKYFEEQLYSDAELGEALKISIIA